MILGERFLRLRIRAFALAGNLALVALAGKAEAQLFTAPVMIDHFQDVTTSVPAPSVPVSPMPAPSPTAPSPAPQADRDTSPNPLWTIPVQNLKATRERPLFSPTRQLAPVAKAPPPAPPAPPPRPPEPEKLQLSLIGTVVGESGQRVGLFVNSADNSSVRLKIGDNHQGWVLRELSPYRAKLDKGQQNTALEFPRSAPKRDVAVAAPPAASPNPPLAAGQSPMAVAPISIVKPPQPASPQVNPFQKFWSR